MPFQQSIQKLFLGLSLVYCLWFCLGPAAIAAAPVAANAVQKTAPVSVDPAGSARLESAVEHYLTGMPDGYYTIGKVQALTDLIATRQPLLVDVREPSEYRSGHIPGAINIPLRTLTDNLSKIPSDRPVVLYCSTGYRSAMGVMTLHLLNYENVQGFPPSFAGWQAAGESIAR